MKQKAMGWIEYIQILFVINNVILLNVILMTKKILPLVSNPSFPMYFVARKPNLSTNKLILICLMDFVWIFSSLVTNLKFDIYFDIVTAVSKLSKFLKKDLVHIINLFGALNTNHKSKMKFCFNNSCQIALKISKKMKVGYWLHVIKLFGSHKTNR